jgi:hypothetical protein
LIRRRLGNHTHIIASHAAVSASINERAEDRTRSMVGEIARDRVTLTMLSAPVEETEEPEAGERVLVLKTWQRDGVEEGGRGSTEVC